MSLLEKHAREIGAIPATHQVFAWEVKFLGKPDYSPAAGVVMTFGATNGVFERGPRKGTTRWHEPPNRFDIPVFVADAVHLRWLDKWEVDNGLCHNCEGSGVEMGSWSATEGTKYRECRRCAGTKLPQRQA